MKLSSLLSGLKKGERATVVGFAEEDIPTKFLDLGLVPGAELEYRCAAPFNGPICVKLCKSKCVLALRKNEADFVLVKKDK